MSQSTAFTPVPVRRRVEVMKQILLMTAVVAVGGCKIEHTAKNDHTQSFP